MPGSCQRPFVFLLIICSKKFYKVGTRFFCSNYESSYSSVNSYLNYFNSGSFSVWLSERNTSRSIDLHQVQVEKLHITCMFYFKGDAENSSAKLDSIKAKLSFEKVISELLITWLKFTRKIFSANHVGLEINLKNNVQLHVFLWWLWPGTADGQKACSKYQPLQPYFIDLTKESIS